ncbi:hypothetical protein EMIT0347P_160029 [Pseudomonas sp. IT-347P]
MGEVMPGMGFFFAADVGPGEVGLGEELDERGGHDDLLILATGWGS